MKALNVLPSDYKPIMSVDMQNNKKTAAIIIVINVLLTVIMVVPVLFVVPFDFFVKNHIGVFTFLLAYFVYIILHELTHAAVMKMFGAKKVHFGFSGLYAYAGSNYYFDRKSYVMIALAPVLLFAVIFGAVNVFVPTSWFWAIYLLQVCNISGAAGDLYVTVRFSRLARDILVHDSGTAMTVFAKQQ